MSDEPRTLLQTVIGVLDASGIPYMVVGSFASAIHGEARSTRDIDIVIDPNAKQLDQLVAALDPELFYVDPDTARDALRRRSMFNVIESATGWKLDLVIRKARPFSIEELRRRQIKTVFGRSVAIATAEDTILAKLEWAKAGASDRQLEDVAGILRVQTSLDVAYLDRWIDELDVRPQWERAQLLVGR
jgi:hypothetical protein